MKAGDRMRMNKSKKVLIFLVSILSVLLLVISSFFTIFLVKNKQQIQTHSIVEKELSQEVEKQSEIISSQEEKLSNFEVEKSEIESSAAEEQASLKQRINELKQWTTTQTTAVTSSAKIGKTVYLTFDDGPSERTPEVLNILDEENIKATFFVVNGNTHNHYMKDIVEKGHTIALHTYTHDYKTIYASDEAYFNDLNAISDLVYAQTGIRSKLLRFPGGSSNTVSRKYSEKIMTRLTKKVEEMGYTYFDWNVSSGDATYPSPSVEQIISNCKRIPKNTDTIIVLFHDSQTKTNTVAALKKIIREYKSQGYAFGQLSSSVQPVHQRVAN